MSLGVLYLAQSRRRQVRHRCGQRITWATLAARGAKSIPLVETPRILRQEKRENGVIVDVIAVDQVHHCPKPLPLWEAKPRRRRAPSSVSSPSTGPRSGHAFSSFTPECIAELKRRVENGAQS